MEILIITAEFAPYSHASTLAQSVASLAKALRGLHHRVTVISPLYATVDPTQRSLARRLSKVQATVGGEVVACELYDGRTTGGVDLIFVGNAERIGTRTVALHDDDANTIVTAAAFSAAAIDVARARDPLPDVVIACGWPAALSLALAAQALPNVRRILTFHDAAVVGRLPSMDAVGLDPRATWLDGEAVTSALAAGVAAADRVVVRSPSLATALLTESTILDGALSRTPTKVTSIVDGLDGSIWNPLTDAALGARFDPADLSGKRHCKAQLQRELSLPERADVPLIVSLVTGADAAELSALIAVGPDLVHNDVQLVVLVRGEAGDLDALKKLQERFTDRMAIVSVSDDAAVRRGMGAADLWLSPSCADSPGQLHRAAQRYGALPIVAAVGTVVDTAVDCDPELTTGNAFLFQDSSSLLPTAQRAIAAFSRAKAFAALRTRVMRNDSSWERAARLYDQVLQSRKLTN